MSCEQVDPMVTPISLNQGWNIIAYLRTSALDAATVLGGIAGNTLIVKSGGGGTFIPNLGINIIGNLEPGQGYKIKMSSAATLYYPAN